MPENKHICDNAGSKKSFWDGVFGKNILRLGAIGMVAFIGFWSGSRVQMATMELRMTSLEETVESQTDAINGLASLMTQGSIISTKADGKINTLNIRVDHIKEDIKEIKNRLDNQ